MQKVSLKQHCTTTTEHFDRALKREQRKQRAFNLDSNLNDEYERYDPMTQDHYNTRGMHHRPMEFEPEYIDIFG